MALALSMQMVRMEATVAVRHAVDRQVMVVMAAPAPVRPELLAAEEPAAPMLSPAEQAETALSGKQVPRAAPAEAAAALGTLTLRRLMADPEAYTAAEAAVALAQQPLARRG